MSSVKPSKSWEIPARPKPGRKPTAATSATLSSSAGSELAASKSSQKAHRERKANYIAELETKVRNYEKEDGTKAVFFQRVAQKLKLENDALRAVVESLNLELSKRPANSVTRGSKRAVEQEHTASDARTKRARSSSTSQSDAPESSEAPASSTASSSEQPACNPPLSSISTLISATEQEDHFFPRCGMCSTDASSCACRDPAVALQVPSLKEPSNPASSIPEAVPISLKRTGKSLWKLDAPVKIAPPPSCSGNPADCPACADDKQGQEFCRSLRSSVNLPPVAGKPTSPTGLPTAQSVSQEAPIYCSDAWMELRAHPNIASANLELLANVVSHHATDAHDHEDSHSQLQPRSDNQHDNETIINSSQNAAVKREWRRRLIIKRDGLDEAIKLLDQHGTALS